MSERGVVAIDRGIWEDPDFPEEPFSEREAFMWLVCEATWKDYTARGTRGPIQLKRGEVCHSIRFMAKAWGWSKSRVKRFLDRLKNRDSIRDTSRDSEKIYFIKNYNRYQRVSLPERDAERAGQRDASGTAAGQQRDKLEDIESSFPNGKGASAPEPLEACLPGMEPPEKPLTAGKLIFDTGKQMMASADKPPRDPGGLIRRWLKDHDEATVLMAMYQTIKQGTPDPIAYMNGCLRKAGGEEQSGRQFLDTMRADVERSMKATNHEH